jgi:hypothetical protein
MYREPLFIKCFSIHFLAYWFPSNQTDLSRLKNTRRDVRVSIESQLPLSSSWVFIEGSKDQRTEGSIRIGCRQFECFLYNATAIVEKMYREPAALLFKIVSRTRTAIYQMLLDTFFSLLVSVKPDRFV